MTPSAVPQMRDLAAMHSNLMEKLRGGFELAVELLSGNHTHLLSDIEAELLSNNKAALLSGNKPEILSNNQMPIFSGNRIEFFSNLKIDIRIENRGNNNGNHPGTADAGNAGHARRRAATCPVDRPDAHTRSRHAAHAALVDRSGRAFGSGDESRTIRPVVAPSSNRRDSSRRRWDAVMLCQHLRQLEAEMLAAGLRETFRGKAWSTVAASGSISTATST